LATERVERRLAAILAADFAGYSRLIGADEEGTLARLKTHRRDLIDPKIDEHRGRIVKTTGDGLLVEFASVVDPLCRATEVQAATVSATPPLQPTVGSSSGSASMWMTSSSRMGTSLAMAPTSSPASKAWRSRAASACRRVCRRMPPASIRLDPRDPRSANRLNQIALGLYFFTEIRGGKRGNPVQAIRPYPDFPNPYRWLAAALSQLGRTKATKQMPAKAIAIAPTAFDMYVRDRVPWMRSEDRAHMLEGLHKAGWQG
jgi:hypothetical protein